uniref:Rab GTPase-binding effector protein 2 n=1 Tax=Sphenodon punctatus TaxID=8508 RepID=A0A8D0HJ55_SPHPU
MEAVKGLRGAQGPGPPQQEPKDVAVAEDRDLPGTIQRLRAELAAALAEVETVRAVATVSEGTKHEAVAAVERRCQEEVASLQAILKDTISSYEARLSTLERGTREQDRGHLLGRSHPLDSLERQMEKAQEDAERLRGIVLPMEQEIAELKGKLGRAEGLIRELRVEQGSLRGSAESLLSDPEAPSPPEEEEEEEEAGDPNTRTGVAGAADAFARSCDSVSIASFSSLGPSPGPPVRRRWSPSPETASLTSTGTLVPETIYLPPAGYQLIPDAEWVQLHAQVHQQQEALASAAQEKVTLEEALRRGNEECGKQVQVLLGQVHNSEQLLQSLQSTVSNTQRRTQEQMAELATSHKRLSYEIQRLNAENEGLRGVTPPSADGDDDLPCTVQELQVLAQRLRQDAESRLRAGEHQAERLRIEIVSLREQLSQEEAAHSSLQGAMEREREERAELLEVLLSSTRSEMERLQRGRAEAELRVREPETLQGVLAERPGQAWVDEKVCLDATTIGEARSLQDGTAP